MARAERMSGSHPPPEGDYDEQSSMSKHRLQSQQLTKSLFIRGFDCPLRLRHALDGLLSNNEDNQYLRVLAEGGFQFEKLVRRMWRGESLRSAVGSVDDAAVMTLDRIRAMHRSGGVLHEAQFAHGDFLARVDMLRLDGNDLLLCEIKAKAAGGPAEGMCRGAALSDNEVGILQKRKRGVLSQWVPYVADVAFQTVVVERAIRAAGLTDLRVHPRLVLANRNARSGQLDHFGNVRRRAAAGSSLRLTEADFEFVEEPPLDFFTPLVLEVDIAEAVRCLREESAQSTAESWAGLTLEALMDEMAEMLRGGGPRAEDERGWKCRDCEFRANRQDADVAAQSGFGRCWQGLAGQAESLFQLYRGRGYQPQYGRPSQRWVHEMLQPSAPAIPASLASLPQERSGGVRASTRSLQIESHRTGTTVCSKHFADRVAARLFPSLGSSTLHFIDFETATACLPYEPGMRPYEVIAFQFSSHSGTCAGAVIDPAGVRHHEWLIPADAGPDHRRTLQSVDREFVDALRAAIGDHGSVLHWASHERTILRAIAERLDPENDFDRIVWLRRLAGETKQDHGRLVDMLSVAEGNVMSPHQQGRYSMKQLLPAACRNEYVWHKLCSLMDWQQHFGVLAADRDPYCLLPALPGSPSRSVVDDDAADVTEGVRCGTDAIRVFQQLHYGDSSTWGDVDDAALRKALKDYCKLDTAAMVAVWVWLTSLAD